jgi:hypothetical protein
MEIKTTTYHSEKNKPNKSVKDMARFLKTKYDVDFYTLNYEALKTQAILKKSYLIDIACDIKEILQDSNKTLHRRHHDIKYENINTMLELFFKATQDPLEQ